jgi:hypothetical protein
MFDTSFKWDELESSCDLSRQLCTPWSWKRRHGGSPRDSLWTFGEFRIGTSPDQFPFRYPVMAADIAILIKRNFKCSTASKSLGLTPVTDI